MITEFQENFKRIIYIKNLEHVLFNHLLTITGIIILLLPAISVFATDEDIIQDLNNMIAVRADQWSTITSTVIAVDHYTGFDISLHTIDGVHPNRQGDKKMADVWTNALLSLKIDSNETIKIMLLGDSITDGNYRFDLWRNLQSEEIYFDFVGLKHNFPISSVEEGLDASDEEMKQFDQDHDGHVGARSDQLIAQSSLKHFKGFSEHLSIWTDKEWIDWLKTLPKHHQPICGEKLLCTEEDVPELRQLALIYLQENRPDIVLLHIGTNDLNAFGKTPEHVVTEIEKIISILQTWNPNVDILVAEIIPFDPCGMWTNPNYGDGISDSSLCAKMIVAAEVAAETEVYAENQGDGCLIATAAFGSEMAPQVQFLREIRDNTVLQTESGTSFMSGFNQFYYSFSPAIADYERENPAFKETVKLALTPLLTSLTLLQYADIDSEYEMLGYGIGVILLNIGMYFVAPAVLIMAVRKRI